MKGILCRSLGLVLKGRNTFMCDGLASDTELAQNLESLFCLHGKPLVLHLCPAWLIVTGKQLHCDIPAVVGS